MQATYERPNGPSDAEICYRAWVEQGIDLEAPDCARCRQPIPTAQLVVAPSGNHYHVACCRAVRR